MAPEPANTVGRFVAGALPERYRTVRVGDLMAKVGRIVEARTPDDTYRLLCSVDDDPASAVLQGTEPLSWFGEQMDEVDQPIDALDRMTLADARPSYRPT
jgi:asparagine synthase (glutamine-hydrolysing)